MKQHQRKILTRALVPIGMLAASLAGLVTQALNENVVRQRLDMLAERVSKEVNERFRRYEYGLRGARGAIIGAGVTGITRKRFSQYVRSRELDTEFPGSRGFGYILRVPAKFQQDFELRVRAEGKPDFAVKQIFPHQGERFVITYIEPETTNEQAVGLDIASEDSRKKAALLSMESGTVVITQPITLVQAEGKPLGGFLLLLPVYREDRYPTTAAERVEDAVGWVYTPLVIDEVLASLSYGDEEYQLSLYDSVDSVATAPSRLFYKHQAQSQGPPRTARWSKEFCKVVTLPLYSRTWAVEVTATPVFLSRLNLTSPFLVAVVFGSFSLLIMLFIRNAMINRDRRQQAWLEREQIALLVENTSDAIIGHTRTGIISSWNHGAEVLFDYPAFEAIGQSFGALLLPRDMQDEEQDRLVLVNSGNHLSSFKTKCLTRSGVLVDVSMTLSPLRKSNGEIVGATRTIRNIGEEKSFEAKLIALNSTLERQVVERTSALNDRNEQLERSNTGFRQIIEASPYALIMVDSNGVMTVFNAKAEDIFGYVRNEVLGKQIELLLPERFRKNHVAQRSEFHSNPVARAMGQGRELFATKKNGEEFPVEIGLSPLESNQGSFVLAAVIDITTRRQQENLIQQFSAFQEAILSNAGFSIIAADPRGTITLFNPSAQRMLGYAEAEIVGKTGPAIFHLPEEIAARAAELSLELDRPVPAGFEAFVAKAQRGQPDEKEWTYVRKDGSRLPVLLNVNALWNERSEIIGYLGIAVDLTERNQSAQKLKDYSEHLSDMVAARTLELELAQRKILERDRLEQELRLAAEIQHSMLPKRPPDISPFDIAMYEKPARFVSGDVYDVIANDANQVFLFLADISGKGVPAALMTSEARTLFRVGLKQSPSPTAILQIIKEILAEDLNRGELFMTCQVSLLDARTGALTYANAGHTESLIYRSGSRTFESYVPTDLPVGVDLPSRGTDSRDHEIAIKPGDWLAFYSDGLTEMADRNGVQFGIERLKRTIAKYASTCEARQLVQEILEALQEFVQGQEAEDDVSLIVARVKPSRIEYRWDMDPNEMDSHVLKLVEACRGYGANFAYELDLLVTELISNIIRHAYGYAFGTGGESQKLRCKIDVSLALEEQEIILNVSDDGKEFVEGSDRSTDGELLAEHGYGLSVMRALADNIHYTRDDKRNRWRIVKKWRGETA